MDQERSVPPLAGIKWPRKRRLCVVCVTCRVYGHGFVGPTISKFRIFYLTPARFRMWAKASFLSKIPEFAPILSIRPKVIRDLQSKTGAVLRLIII